MLERTSTRSTPRATHLSARLRGHMTSQLRLGVIADVTMLDKGCQPCGSSRSPFGRATLGRGALGHDAATADTFDASQGSITRVKSNYRAEQKTRCANGNARWLLSVKATANGSGPFPRLMPTRPSLIVCPEQTARSRSHLARAAARRSFVRPPPKWPHEPLTAGGVRLLPPGPTVASRWLKASISAAVDSS